MLQEYGKNILIEISNLLNQQNKDIAILGPGFRETILFQTSELKLSIMILKYEIFRCFFKWPKVEWN